ncbi:MAG: RidA family protein [Actinomycetia bacterium]|nr:RidA family protein [Actinomycetes bacterium]
MKEIIYTSEAPEPLGPYSQAVKVGNLIFLSGQIPINPKTGEVITGTIEEQTRLVLNNIRAVLEEANSSLDNLLKLTIYLDNLNEFTNVNSVFNDYFQEKYPARETVEVSCLPKNVGIEISAIAISP